MNRFPSRRIAVAAGLLAACAAGAIVSAQRASAAMTNAATAFLGSLTPEQRKQATVLLDSLYSGNLKICCGRRVVKYQIYSAVIIFHVVERACYYPAAFIDDQDVIGYLLYFGNLVR